MMNLVSDVWSILTPPQRRYVLVAQFASLLMAFSTVTGIAAIAPFFAVLGEPQMIEHNALLHALYVQFGFSSRRSFVVAPRHRLHRRDNYRQSDQRAWLARDESIGVEHRQRTAVELVRRIPRATLPFPRRHHSTTALQQYHLRDRPRVQTASCRMLHTGYQPRDRSVIILSILLLNPAVGGGRDDRRAGGRLCRDLPHRAATGCCASGTPSRTLPPNRQGSSTRVSARSGTLSSSRSGISFATAFERASRGFSLAAAHSQVVGQIPKHIMNAWP